MIADQLQGFGRGSWVLPEMKVFQDTPDEKRLFYERDDLHLPSVLWVLQGINIFGIV